MEKGFEDYEKLKQKVDVAETTHEKADLYTKMAALEDEAREEATILNEEFNKEREGAKAARKEVDAKRKELRSRPESDKDRAFMDKIRNELKLSPEREAEIKIETVQIGGLDKDQLKTDLREKSLFITDKANELLENEKFTTSPDVKNIKILRLTFEELGLPDDSTTDDIYKRAKELGFDLCPAEVGLNYRAQNTSIERCFIAMEPITDLRGDPYLFKLETTYKLGPKGDPIPGSGPSGIDAKYVRPDFEWFPGNSFVFSVPSLEESD